MAGLTFQARGDSGTASNASINVENTNQTPVTEITFVATEGGNVILDFNDGAADPDTRVMVDGVEYQFRVELSGNLAGRGLNNVGGSDLSGERVVLITLLDYPEPGDSQRLFFLPDANPPASVMQSFPNGARPVNDLNTEDSVLICFCAGTLIRTPDGDRPVETLRVGDPVSTLRGGAVPVRWIGLRRLSAAALRARPEFRPVRIRRDSFGEGLPRRDLRVSPQHRVLLSGWKLELLFGEERMLAPARHLVDGLAVTVEPAEDAVEYYHILCDAHEILISEGLPTESFHPGAWSLGGLAPEARAELLALFPALAEAPAARPAAAPCLRGREARALMAYFARAA